MTTYKMAFGPTIFDIREDIRDLQVKFKDNLPSEIQVWQTRQYFLEGHLIKSDAPWCTVVKLHPRNVDGIPHDVAPGDGPFASLGITLDQALTVLAVIASQASPVPDNAVSGTVVRPEIPSGVADSLAALRAEVASVTVTLGTENDNVRLAQDQLAQLNEALAKIAEDMTAKQAEWDAFILDATTKKEAIEGHLLALDTELRDKSQIVSALDEAIVEKSTESSALTAKIEAQSRASQPAA